MIPASNAGVLIYNITKMNPFSSNQKKLHICKLILRQNGGLQNLQGYSPGKISQLKNEIDKDTFSGFTKQKLKMPQFIPNQKRRNEYRQRVLSADDEQNNSPFFDRKNSTGFSCDENCMGVKTAA